MAMHEIVNSTKRDEEALSRKYPNSGRPMSEVEHERSALIEDKYPVSDVSPPPMFAENPEYRPAPATPKSDSRAASVGEDFTVSEALGLPLLVEEPAPLSSALHVPTLTADHRDERAPNEPYKRPAGIIDSEFSLSRWLGLPLLVNNPTPLSSALGIPTLVDDTPSPRVEDRRAMDDVSSREAAAWAHRSTSLAPSPMLPERSRASEVRTDRIWDSEPLTETQLRHTPPARYQEASALGLARPEVYLPVTRPATTSGAEMAAVVVAFIMVLGPLLAGAMGGMAA